jgi:putative Holliday junction resolvase
VLGIDPGTRRIGLAVSDALGMTAQGLETFEIGRGIELIDRIRELVEEYGISEIVLGLPLSMGGGEIEGTERSRELADLIGRECGVKVVLQDERMTSLEAERVIGQEGKIQKAGDIDKLSAVLLLQSYLDERKRHAEG